MFGKESVAALEQRASTIGARAYDEAPQDLLPDAREALNGMEAELGRDQGELDEAQARYAAKFWPVSRYLPRHPGKRFAEAELEPIEREIEGDRAAIARLARTVNRLNQRVDAASYGAVNERMRSYDLGLNLVSNAVLTSIDDRERSLAVLNRGEGEPRLVDAPALILALGASAHDTRDLSRIYSSLRRNQSLNATNAALLAVHGGDPAAVSHVETDVRNGRNPNAAAILATASDREAALAIYTRLTGEQWAPALAAQIATAAANAGVPRERALRITRKLAASHPEGTATLVSLVFATNRPADQITAAFDWFAQRDAESAAMATAAWALEGKNQRLMANLAALHYRAEPESDDSSLVMRVATTMGPAR